MVDFDNLDSEYSLDEIIAALLDLAKRVGPETKVAFGGYGWKEAWMQVKPANGEQNAGKET